MSPEFTEIRWLVVEVAEHYGWDVLSEIMDKTYNVRPFKTFSREKMIKVLNPLVQDASMTL